MTAIPVPPFALAALAALAAPAIAAAAPDQRSSAVEVGDLDLATDRGQRILALRIQRAARSLCRAEAVASLSLSIRNEQQCIRDAKASALAAVQAVTAAAERESGRGG